MNTVLVTGANRGLGLEFSRQYAEKGFKVIATCRDVTKAKELNQLAEKDNVEIKSLDICSQSSISTLKESLANVPIDLLINNAGIYGGSPQNFESCDIEQWQETLLVNAISPIIITRSLMPALLNSAEPKVIFITSKMGSMGDNGSGGSYIYRSSKAALNACIKSFSIDFADKIKTLAMHPGWVRTDMGGPNGLINATQSVSGMIETIDTLKSENSGSFVDYQGKLIPW
ncbi:SDR family oxidoreductase [Pleionea sediminis]|uniref:SDR family oxidoreductase n=1 Tax=Pleionea sediminis TaxID=2569479 RepID=UPI00118675F2|nr:SDR family oxidoreductase [Pleionea sediminis]